MILVNVSKVLEARKQEKNAQPVGCAQEEMLCRLSTGSHRHHSWLCLFGSTHVHLVRLVDGEQHRRQSCQGCQSADWW